jgi:hypothetical protein
MIMKSYINTLLLILICLGAISCSQHKQPPVVEKAQPQSATEIVSKASESASAPSATVREPKGFVPAEQTAIAIAVAVWTPIYGKAQIENEKPYKAKLSNGVWTVMGSLPEGYSGGTAVAEISQADGRILKVIHYQ